MHELLVHAASLGVSVHVAHLPHPYRGYFDAERRIVVYSFTLTPIEKRCVLAHEFGHAFHGHACFGDKAAEDAADLYAAQLLIDPAEYARLERVYPSAETIAEELEVTEELLTVFQARVLTRMRGMSYARARMGSAAFRQAHAAD